MILNEQRIRVIEEFLRDYSIKHTGSSIAQKKKINQKSVANILNEFEELGVLSSESSGRNKLYFLQQKDREELEQFLVAIECLRTMLFYKKHLLVKEILGKIKPFCRGALLVFGSYAKGVEKKDSDLDLLVIGKADEKEIAKIQEAYSIEINLKQYPLHIFRELFKTDPLLKEVIKNHLFIKDTEEIISLLLR